MTARDRNREQHEILFGLELGIEILDASLDPRLASAEPDFDVIEALEFAESAWQAGL
jgi:hypothetical protein